MPEEIVARENDGGRITLNGREASFCDPSVFSSGDRATTGSVTELF